jgi:acetolactate synthase-1/2/3 large subunit
MIHGNNLPSGELMKAAELFIKCLENEGVKVIFGIPGEENIDVMDAILDSTINS